MGNTRQPNSPQRPDAANLELQERIGELELQVAEQRARAEAPGAEPGDRPMQQDELSAELERHRDQLRDYEKALVERIADVDDDRRATASRLQRAWQTQREEIDDRLRRHAGLMAGLLFLFAVIFAVALFLVYRQAATERPQVAAEVAAMRQEIERIGGDELSSKPLEVELARLGAEVEDIASSLERRSMDEGRTDRVAAVAERSAGEAGEARIAEEMQRLKGEQASLKAQIESLRADMAAAQEARVSVPAAELHSGEPTTGEAEQGGTPAAEAGTEDIAAVAQEGATDTSGAGADADADADALGSEETLMAGEGSYALQLIGFFDRDSMAAFAARDGLPARVYYLRQTHKGRPWYALVHSLHEGYAAAAEERSRLPADLVALSPWIRPLPAGTELRVLVTGPAR